MPAPNSTTGPEIVARRVAVLGMVVSGLLAVAKLIVGSIAGSTAVVADGVESAADVVTSGAVLFGLVVASRPPDEDHPYGHGRFEILTGLGIGMVLSLTGVVICVRSAIEYINHRGAPPAAYAVWPLIASIVLKTGLAVAKFRYGRKVHSAALTADAQNDSVDILSGSVALTALALTLINPARFLEADHVGGFVVGIIVVFLGIRVSRETSLDLMDTMPDAATIEEIRRVALSVPGAMAVEKCYARKTGLQHHVDLHLEVDPEMTVRQSHYLGHIVQERIRQELPWVAGVLVHVEPFGGPFVDPE